MPGWLATNERKVFRIYALLEPDVRVARYVGQTADTLEHRLDDQVRRPGRTAKALGCRRCLTWVSGTYRGMIGWRWDSDQSAALSSGWTAGSDATTEIPAFGFGARPGRVS